jgi:hypothetical protein
LYQALVQNGEKASSIGENRGWHGFLALPQQFAGPKFSKNRFAAFNKMSILYSLLIF